jgi:hypothetical protein
VGHCRIGRHGDAVYPVRRDSGGSTDPADKGLDTFFGNGPVQPLQAAGPGAFDDPVDYVGAIPDLAVSGGTHRNYFSRFKIQEHHGDRCCANVYGKTRNAGNRRGGGISPDNGAVKIEDPFFCAFIPDHTVNGKFPVPEYAGELPEGVYVNGKFRLGNAVPFRRFAEKPFPVCGSVIKSWQ